MGKKASPADNWAMLCHLLGLCVFTGIPLGNIIGPLVVWLIKGKEYKTVDNHGKESLNFQISITVYSFIAALLICVFIGWILLIILAIADIAFIIIASMKASEGKSYKYPYIFRLIK